MPCFPSPKNTSADAEKRGQWLAMGFAQLSYRESLRDIENCLRTRSDLYHLGFRVAICHSTLAEANESRDWKIYHDLAQILIRKARKLYINDPTAGLIHLEREAIVGCEWK